MRISVSLPCYLRPKRTIRAIENIFAQTINGWEALVVGDGCPEMQNFLDSNYFSDMISEATKKGNILSISNLETNMGGHGYFITNMNIERAKGKYFVFMANDDVITENHFENYLSAIENTEYDFVYFNSFVEPYNGIRNAELRYGGIGHSEIIVRTEYLQLMPKHNNEYGHDWALIHNLLSNSNKYIKAHENPATYIVKGLPSHRNDEID